MAFRAGELQEADRREQAARDEAAGHAAALRFQDEQRALERAQRVREVVFSFPSRVELGRCPGCLRAHRQSRACSLGSRSIRIANTGRIQQNIPRNAEEAEQARKPIT